MNDTAWQTGGPMIEGGPAWLTLSFVLIGIGIVAALLVLWWGTRLSKQRRDTRDELLDRGEAVVPGDTAPVAPPPPPIAETPIPASPVKATEPVAEEAPAPDAIADEPIAAAAPMDASPASLAASEPEAPAGADDLTRMKGVGPKLAERLQALGVTRFAQIAALSPAEAEALDAQLGNFQGRLKRDRWIEQAQFLAAGDIAGYEAVFGKL
jgi:predicted flap endonuclease-1-like 5' DNA nuclease